MVSEKMVQILACLLEGCNNGEPANSPITAVSVTELVISTAIDVDLGSESTIYKNLVKLMNLGFVRTGISRGKQFTYYITEKGEAFFEGL